MGFNNELLDVLICPKSKGQLEVVDLPPAVSERMVERFKEYFTDELPEVSNGLLSREAGLVYPIVSGMPVLLIDEALEAGDAGVGSGGGSGEA